MEIVDENPEAVKSNSLEITRCPNRLEFLRRIMLLSTPKFRIKQIDERQISRVKRQRGERFEHEGELRKC